MIFCLTVLYPEQMNEFRAEEVAAAGGGGGASISSAVQSRQTSWASLGKYLSSFSAGICQV
jgi:hypothetical protein